MDISKIIEDAWVLATARGAQPDGASMFRGFSRLGQARIFNYFGDIRKKRLFIPPFFERA